MSVVMAADVMVKFLSGPHKCGKSSYLYIICCDYVLDVHIKSSSVYLQGSRKSKNSVAIIPCQTGEKLGISIWKTLARYWRIRKKFRICEKRQSMTGGTHKWIPLSHIETIFLSRFHHFYQK